MVAYRPSRRPCGSRADNALGEGERTSTELQIPVTGAARSRRLASVVSWHYVAGTVLVTACCWIAHAGGEALLLTGPSGTIWPATGVGIAVLYLGGLRWLPGVLLGDLLARVFAQVPLPQGVMLAEAAGAITTAVVAAVILQRLIGSRASVDRLRHVGAVLVAVGVGSAISATIAMFALRISDLIETSEMVVFWRTWWLGTLAGGLVVLPLAMAWAVGWTVGWRTAAWRSGRLAEGVLMLASVAGLSVVALSVEQQVTYLVFPAFIWAALRFGPQGATLAVALSTGIAMAITAYDRGAFIERETDQSALNLQLYVLIASVSTLCLAAIVSERRRAEVELADSRARIVAAGARERRRLEAELHDSGQNRIVALLMRLGLARETAESAAPDLVPSLDLMIADAEAMTEELRRIAHGILPPVLASEGIAAALRAETVYSAIGVRVVDDGVGRSEQDVELAVYLCCLEAIQNAAKHAGRRAAATVTLQPVAGELRFTVHDTGAGFDTEAASPGAGLTNVRDRIETVGGRIEVVSALGRGTKVSGAVPWPSEWR